MIHDLYDVDDLDVKKVKWYDAPLIFTPTPTSKIFWASQIDIHPYRRHSRRTSRLGYARGIIGIERHKTKSGSSGFRMFLVTWVTFNKQGSSW